jgi:hypothetical protein
MKKGGRVKEGKCDGCTLYTCMKIEQCNLLKLLYAGVGAMREKDGGG